MQTSDMFHPRMAPKTLKRPASASSGGVAKRPAIRSEVQKMAKEVAQVQLLYESNFEP